MPRVSMLLLPLLGVALFQLPPAFAQQLEHRPAAISQGAEAIDLIQRVTDIPMQAELDAGVMAGASFAAGANFLAYNFDRNATETGGFLFIPPDPCGAAGLDRVLAVVNVGIECRTKAGALLWRDSLKDFIAPVAGVGASTFGSFTFDPKVVYDHYEDRFVVVTLERQFTASGDPTNDSRILIAVSKTSAPASATGADWYYYSINSNINIGGSNHWADYPGFEVDEEVVYITANMFPYPGGGGGGGQRLWIVHKGVVGGFYGGGVTTFTVHDPATAAGMFALTMQPALVFGAGGAGAGIGTYLVGYSGLTFGGPGANEVLQVIRVNNPTGPVSFSGQFVNVGDLEDIGGAFGFPAIPDAPQLGSNIPIEVNDSRALDAVWRDNNLWVTTTINPNAAQSAANVGQATAHWFRLNTTTPAAITVADQGNIGGEDIAANTWTFFPSVAVNGAGDAKFGFAASASTIYGGAYFAGRHPGDAAGTVQTAGAVQVGLDYYVRTFGTPGIDRNRWGDYTGAAVDPSNDSTFWLFNSYAMARGTLLGGEDGRWGTAWLECAPVVPPVLDWGDAPDPMYPTLAASLGASHVIVPGVFLGAVIDPEPDGQPNASATGDDLAGLADEDGVVFATPLIAGSPAAVHVTASVGGQLDAWIDFNGDGVWGAGEKILSVVILPGLNALGFPVPPGATTGSTFARFRFNGAGIVLPTTGPAPDGEVEDYRVVIEALDYGDAPDTYRTLLASAGASHVITGGIFLGASVDGEPDGNPTPGADGDDLTNFADEDGVTVTQPLLPGAGSNAVVVASAPAWLDAWIDFDLNGSFDPSDLIFSGPLVAGPNAFPFPVPPSAVVGTTYARFRYTTTVGPNAPSGPLPDGEVEDYKIEIAPAIDFGDAPDPTYPTLIASNGAHHIIVPGVFLGNIVEPEADGQPNATATGDDINGAADEDGVSLGTLIPGTVNSATVTASAPGWVDLWIDLDLSGLWDPHELLFSGPVVPGVNGISFGVPYSYPISTPTFARVRYNTGGPLPPFGPAPDGEVEDYQVTSGILLESPDSTTPKFGILMGAPNPFRSQFTIQFAIPEPEHVEIKVFTMDGRLAATLVDESMASGAHSVQWNGRDDTGRNVTAGVYFYRLRAGTLQETRKVMLIQ